MGRLTGINYLSESPKYTPDIIFAYDLQGNRTRMTEKMGLATVRETHYGYDDVRRLTQVGFDTNGDSTIEQSVSYKYDAGGLWTEMELPGGLKITYAYDARGQLVSLKDWDNQVQRYYHDHLGRLRSLLRSNGVETDYKYDGSGRLLDLHHQQASRTLHRLLYQVDGRGNRTQMQEITPADTPMTETILSNDARVVYYRGQWQTNGNYRFTNNLRAALRLELVGQQFQVTLGTGPNHGICDIYLDNTFWGSRDTYAATSGEETLTLDAYLDGAHVLEIRQHAEKNLASTGYTLSFKQVVVTTAYATQTVQYVYDMVSRLLQAKYHDSASVVGTPFRQYGYTYDRAGNRMTNKVWLEGALNTNLAYTYNMANQLTSDGTRTFTWDANGNLTGDGTQIYAWDRANRLRQMFDGTDTYAYTYNGFGQRIQQTLNPSGSNVVTQYLLDVQPGLYKVIASTIGANTTRYIHDSRGIFAQESPNGDWRWMLNDGLGSVRDVVNNSADVLASTQYAPYGEVWDSSGTPQTNFGFTGESTDANDLVHLRARYYNPTLAIFPSIDPLETANRYAYVGSNPIRFRDPSGLIFEPDPSSVCFSNRQQTNEMCAGDTLGVVSWLGFPGIEFREAGLFDDILYVDSLNEWTRAGLTRQYPVKAGSQVWTNGAITPKLHICSNDIKFDLPQNTAVGVSVDGLVVFTREIENSERLYSFSYQELQSLIDEIGVALNKQSTDAEDNFSKREEAREEAPQYTSAYNIDNWSASVGFVTFGGGEESFSTGFTVGAPIGFSAELTSISILQGLGLPFSYDIGACAVVGLGGCISISTNGISATGRWGMDLGISLTATVSKEGMIIPPALPNKVAEQMLTSGNSQKNTLEIILDILPCIFCE